MQIKGNIEGPRHWPLWGEFTGDRWIPRTKGQWRGKCFHLMTSSRPEIHLTMIRYTMWICIRILSFVLFLLSYSPWRIRVNHLLKSLRVGSPAQGQSYNSRNIVADILRDTLNIYPSLTTIYHDENKIVYMGLYSLSGRTSRRKITRSQKYVVILFQSLWNVTGASVAALTRCLSNFRTIRS